MLEEVNQSLVKLFPKTNYYGFDLWFTGFIPAMESSLIVGHIKVWPTHGYNKGPYVNISVPGSTVQVYSPGDVFLINGGLLLEGGQAFNIGAVEAVLAGWRKAIAIAKCFRELSDTLVGGEAGLVKIGNFGLTEIAKTA